MTDHQTSTPATRPVGRFEWEAVFRSTPVTPVSVKALGLTLATYANTRTGTDIRPGVARLDQEEARHFGADHPYQRRVGDKWAGGTKRQAEAAGRARGREACSVTIACKATPGRLAGGRRRAISWGGARQPSVAAR